MKAYVAPELAEKAREIYGDEIDYRRRYISGTSQHGEQFWIRDTVLLSMRGRELTLQVNELDYGPPDLQASPQKQYLIATLSGTEFARRRPRHELEQNDDTTSLRVSSGCLTNLDAIVLENVDDYVPVRLGNTPHLVEHPVTWLHGEVRAERTTAHPMEVIETFVRESRSFLAILDLLERRRVFWTDVRIQSSTTEQPDTDDIITGKWRTARATERASYLSPMVLCSDESMRMATAMSASLAASPYRDRLAAATAFINAAHGDGYLEERTIAAFAAFEATVNSLTAPSDPADGDIRRVQTELHAVLDGVPGGSISPIALERARQRIAQLPDVPLARKAALLVNAHGVAWRDLWPGSEDLEAQLRIALRIRNSILHTGHLSVGFAARPESERIVILTERLLFNALGGDERHVYAGAYRHVGWILRELSELRGSDSATT